jgi:hypothetical protein
MTDANKIALIRAAMACLDQLVFLYHKKDGTTATRFVSPIEVEDPPGGEDADQSNVLCRQILPKRGHRKYKLFQMDEIRRVSTRMEL